MTHALKIAFLGLGEDACQIANGLKNAGATVVGFDSVKPKYPPIRLADSVDAAVAGADIIFSLNSANVSLRVAQLAARELNPDAIYVDLNAGTPSLKRKLAQIIPAARFVDGALMKPVDDLAEAVPIAVSGKSAARLVKVLKPIGMNLEFVSEVPGEAAARKLIGGILDRGMAALVTDTLWAAKSLGLEDWAIEAVREKFDSASAATVQGYLNETGLNPKRLSVEMGDVVEMLTDANYDSTMVNGISLTFSHVMHGRRIPFADLNDR